MSAITLDQIRDHAEALARASAASKARAALIQEEIEAAVQPVWVRHQAALDAAADEVAQALEALDALLAGAPQLFSGKKRSLTVNGVRCGYRKEEDALDLPEAAELIQRIKALAPELAPILIRTEETPVIDALAQLESTLRRRLGIRLVEGADRRFISVGDSDVEKLAKLALAAAAQRRGDDESPSRAVRGKKAKTKGGA